MIITVLITIVYIGQDYSNKLYKMMFYICLQLPQ